MKLEPHKQQTPPVAKGPKHYENPFKGTHVGQVETRPKFRTIWKSNFLWFCLGVFVGASAIIGTILILSS